MYDHGDFNELKQCLQLFLPLTILNAQRKLPSPVRIPSILTLQVTGHPISNKTQKLEYSPLYFSLIYCAGKIKATNHT